MRHVALPIVKLCFAITMKMKLWRGSRVDIYSSSCKGMMMSKLMISCIYDGGSA